MATRNLDPLKTERRLFIGYATTAECDGFTGYAREISVNEETTAIRVHDGVTAGGVETARNDLANVSKANMDKAISASLDDLVPPIIAKEIADDIAVVDQRITTEVATLNSSISQVSSRVDSNDSDISSLQSGKADKATTLAGYGIADAYTKSEVDGKLDTKANKATSLAGYGIADAYTKTQTDGLLATKVNTSQIEQALTHSTTNIPSSKAVSDAINAGGSLPAYEGIRIITCNGSTTVNLADTDEMLGLRVESNSSISFNLSSLTFPKQFYTIQLYVFFPNGVKTISLSSSVPIDWINGAVADFSSGKGHWLVLRSNNAGSTLLLSDAGEIG